jgi:hypothetical protein
MLNLEKALDAGWSDCIKSARNGQTKGILIYVEMININKEDQMMTPEGKKRRSDAAKKAAKKRKLSARAKKANVSRGSKGRKAAAKKAIARMKEEGKL